MTKPSEKSKNTYVDLEGKVQLHTPDTLANGVTNGELLHNSYLESDFTKKPVRKITFKKNESVFNAFFVFVLTAVIIGDIINGFTDACINRFQDDIEKFYNASTVKGTFTSTVSGDFHWGIVASGLMFGSLPGTFIAGWLSNHVGRKKTMLLNMSTNVIAGIISFFSVTEKYYSPDRFLVARIFTGINMGINMVVLPTYLIEICPTSIRGAIGNLFELGYGLGMLLGYSLGLPSVLGSLQNWGWLFGGCVFFAPAQIIMLLLSPESPRYLLINCGKEKESRVALKKLRGHDDIEDEIEDMRFETKRMTKRKMSTIELLKTRHLYKALLVGCLAQLIQQLHGTGIIFAYSNIILNRAGLSDEVAGYATLGSGFVTVIAVLISSKWIDRRGRKEMLLIGLIGLQFSYILLTVGYVYSEDYIWGGVLAIMGVILAMGFSAVGPYPIPWFIVSEIFPQGPRAAAMSFCGVVNRITGITAMFTFPLLQDIFKDYVFVIFIVLCFVFCLVTKFVFPETRGRTFSQISQELTGKVIVDLESSSDDDLFNDPSTILFQRITVM